MSLSPQENTLVLGYTGSGKTYPFCRFVPKSLTVKREDGKIKVVIYEESHVG